MPPIRVMVVDDAADARFLITLVLGDAEGIEVVAEADGAESALAQLDAGAPDVVLVDARMPAVDGYQLTGMLLERRPGLRVALLTSVVDAVVQQQATDAGAAACWSKAEMEGLADAIRELAAG
jgi:DNA-binding NarL/FixJ family response regulator